MSPIRSFTLALGGGGVKCFAHIGVLEALEERNEKVGGIAATSAGALIAALYASGRSPNEIINLGKNLDFKALSKRKSADLRSLWGLSKWKQLFVDLFGNLRMESLSFPIAFPLVNLEANRECVVRTGLVSDAVAAAVAIPGIFPPQIRNGKQVMDGGVLNPVPIGLARSLAPEAETIAVPLVPPMNQWDQHPFPKLIKTVPLLRLLGKLRYTQALDVYVQASDLTNRLLVEYRLKDEKPDFIIRPDVNHLGLFDRIDFNQIVAAGKNAAFETLKGTDARS